MASLRKRMNGTPHGSWEIQFRDEYRRKKTITLSGRKYKERFARQLQDAVEVLVNKKNNRDPTQHAPTKAWVDDAPQEIKEKLARFGLYDLPSRYTTEELWDKFLEHRQDMHEPTRKIYLQAKEKFFMFFKPEELVNELSQDRMKAWKAFLLDCGKFAPPTVAGTIAKVKAVFNWAKEQKWFKESPLDGVGRGSSRNEANDRFVTQEDYRKLLGACPDQEWRVIITLARLEGCTLAK